MKKRTVLFTQCVHREIFGFDLGLGVADIQIVAPVGAFLRPYPDIGNIFVPAVPIQPALNIPFQTGTKFSRGNGIVPTVNRRAFKPQADIDRVGFGIVDPSLNVKFGNGGFIGRCGFLRRFSRRRFRRWFFFRRGAASASVWVTALGRG